MQLLITKFLRIMNTFLEIPSPYPHHALGIKIMSLINKKIAIEVKNNVTSSSNSVREFGWENGITQVGLCPAHQA